MRPGQLSPEDQRAIARTRGDRSFAHIKRVIVEVHNFCNRACSFCPNSFLDRRRQLIKMEPSLYSTMLRQLADAGFTGTLMYGRYHEPLADPIIIDRIAEARAVLPSTRLLINTNGDYLSVDYMKRLLDAGLSELRIMVYLPEKTSYSDAAALAAIERFSRRLGLGIAPASSLADTAYVYSVYSPAEAAGKASIHCENYGKAGYGADRGGSVQDRAFQLRDVPCHAPHFEINIDYDGSMMPCCNLQSEVAAHKDFVLGNLNKTDLLDLFFSTKSEDFKARTGDVSSLPPVCRTCQYYWPNRTS